MLFTAACTSVTMVDTTGVAPACASECVNNFNVCGTGELKYFMPIRANNQCVAGMQICVNKCPLKTL